MTQTRDTSGFSIFDHGDVGAAHVMAHRLLDEDRPAEGYERLGRWLEGREGTGSDWVHLQWHMMVFELAIGEWAAARSRFDRHILGPAAQGLALTDAPAALWRLMLARPALGPSLPWQVAHAAATRVMWAPADDYVELHCLLALAGAGDTASLDEWLRRRPPYRREDHTLQAFAAGFRSHSVGRFGSAAQAFAAALPGLGALGGSRAQNELFVAIARDCARRAQSTGGAAEHADAKTEMSTVRSTLVSTLAP